MRRPLLPPLTAATTILLAATLTACTVDTPGADVPPAEGSWDVEVVADGLEHIWEIAELPDGDLLITERPGRISVISDGDVRELDADLDDVYAQGEGGLMGLALSPSYADDGRFWSCQATTADDVKVVGWTMNDDATAAERDDDPLIDGMPLNPSGRHSGCRLRFGADGMLYVGTGDSAQGANPQDLGSLGGKVLRIDATTGEPPSDNPFIDSTNPDTRLVYTYGHRNVQGLAVRPGTGEIFSVEHGPDVDDEINLLQAGGNYGWNPVGSGTYNESVPMTDTSIDGAIEAIWSSGSPTVATCDAAFLTGEQWGEYDGALAVSTLKGQHLMLVTLDGDEVASTAKPAELDGEHGRLRAVTAAGDGTLLVGTSGGDDDKVLRVTPG